MKAMANIPKRGMKLRSKMFLSSSLIVLMAISVISLILYSYAADKVTDIYYDNTSNTLKLEGNYLEQRIMNLMKRITAMRLNYSFEDTLSGFFGSDTPEAAAYAISYFSDLLSELRSTDSFVKSVFINTDKGNFFDLSMAVKYTVDFNKTRAYKLICDNPDKPIIWGGPMADEFYSGNEKVIPVIFCFKTSRTNKEVTIVLNLSESKIYEYLSDAQEAKDSWTVIADTDANLVVSAKDTDINTIVSLNEVRKKFLASENGFHKAETKFGGYLITYTQIAKYVPWKMVNIKSQADLFHSLNSFKYYTLVITLIALACCFIIALLISRTVTKPLYLLRSTITKVKDKNFDVYFDYQYRDEVGELGESFNYMVNEIKTLIDQLKDEKERVRIEQLLKRRAELKALQAQINPHFLYNTLDSINWKATEIGADDISEMTTALATLFRAGLSKGNEISPLSDEIAHVTGYMVIQKMRYGDKFDYLIDFGKEFDVYYSVKLILQPLVENSIYHGIKEKKCKGFIEVRGEIRDRSIDLLVIDDGVGFPEDKLEIVNEKLRIRTVEDKDGYGIFNVNERIKLYFGDEYGLQYSYDEQGRTVAKIAIPKVLIEDVDRYVQYFSR